MPPGPSLVLVRQERLLMGEVHAGSKHIPRSRIIIWWQLYVCMVALIRYGLIPGLYDYD